MSLKTHHFYEFGAFRLDPAERVLLRAGEVVPLTPKAFETLLLLVEQSGHVVDKDELMRRVWPDTFVEEVNMAKNISALRKVLGEGEAGEKYIETIPKRGYRFVAQVRRVSDGDAEAAVPEGEREARTKRLPAGVPTPAVIPDMADDEPQMSGSAGPATLPGILRHRKVVAVLALAILVIAAGGLTLWLAGRGEQRHNHSGRSGPYPRIIPVTSFTGYERQPSFSPDGKQIAFVWDGEREDNADIYVRLTDAGEPLRLTSNPSPDLNPVWSPDGRHIAFTREGEGSGIYLVPALGGTERKLAAIYRERLFHTGSLSYSPDGEWLAVPDKDSVAEPYSIFLFSVATGERRRLTPPPADSIGDESPAFSPDGQTVAFTRTRAPSAKDIYVVPVSGGEPKRLTYDEARIVGLAWTADGSEIVFSSWRGGRRMHYLWRVPAGGGDPERVAVFAQGVYDPSISREGNRLAWAQAQDDLRYCQLNFVDR